MYIIIPLLIIVGSTGAVFFIVWNKRAYLNKLYTLNSGPEADLIALGFNWKEYGVEFFPEIRDWLNNLKLDGYRLLFLMELEKSLRKTRLIFMRVDRWSDALIKKVRRVHVNGKLNGNGNGAVVVNGQMASETMVEKVEIHSSNLPSTSLSPAFLKNEEERFIIEIAQNPKDPTLYEGLGDLYIEMGNFADAKESYEAALELSAQNESLKQKLSSVLEKLV